MDWWIPVLIFFARICDVSISTVRTMLLLSGNRWLTPILGFFEVTIWVLAVSGVIANLTNPIAVVAYAGGFAAGVYVGMLIEDRLAIGFRMVRVINTDKGLHLSSLLRDRGYRVTQVDGSGRDGPVEIAFLAVPRRRVRALESIIWSVNPDAFVTVERVDRPSGGRAGAPALGITPKPLLGGFAK